jgi:hypothetical protein
MLSEKMQKLADEAMHKIRANMECELESMEKRAMSKIESEGEFDHNDIESTWGKILEWNKAVTEDLIGKASCRVFEKELVKKNGWREEQKAGN